MGSQLKVWKVILYQPTVFPLFFSFCSQQKSLRTEIIFQRLTLDEQTNIIKTTLILGPLRNVLMHKHYFSRPLTKNHLPKNKCKCNVNGLWKKCIAKIFSRSLDLESVDELALKIEPLMYYTGEGGGNDMRECPDGNWNANISWAKKYKMEWTDVSLGEVWRAPNRRMEQ